ncbi:hypothetical protein AMTRI_Chr09g14760 [Amborella trichopoda]
MQSSQDCDKSSFAKTICSICFEDLKPITEDLRCISTCGHVFHDLCLQQWFEYCPVGKKNSCPICKQHCSQKNVTRLFFQSISECMHADASKKSYLSGSGEVDHAKAEALQADVAKLEGQLAAANRAITLQQKSLKELNEELSVTKSCIEKSEAARDAILKEKIGIQHVLQRNIEELSKSTSECSRLQERSLSLAKELASYKLVSDLDLDEEDVLRLASIGHGSNSNDIIETLNRSLVLRNKRYKELMAQCNLLGRGESRSFQKFERAIEKIKKLKARVQELERALEEKENEALRSLTISKGVENSAYLSRFELNSVKTIAPVGLSTKKEEKSVKPISIDVESDACLIIDGHGGNPSTVPETPSTGLEPQIQSRICKETEAHKTNLIGPSTKNMPPKSGNVKMVENKRDGAVNRPLDTSLQESLVAESLENISSFIPITKETSVVHIDSISTPGFIGSMGSSMRASAKWCRPAQSEACSSGSSIPRHGVSGDLIAVGSDGRGGRIKVLRSQNSFFDVGHEGSLWERAPKRCKIGAKQGNNNNNNNSNQSRGCHQIEHYFQRSAR